MRCAIIAGTDAAASAEEDGDPVFKLIRALAFVLWLAVTALDLYIELDPRFTVGVPVKLAFAAAFIALWSLVFPPTRRHMGK